METQKLIVAFQESWNSLVAAVPNILAAVLILAIGIFVANKITDLSRRVIDKKSSDPLMSSFLVRTIKIVLVLIIGMFALKIVGLDGIATGMLTAAGASAVILGFAFKDIGENFISGIILSFNRPFNVNDTVTIGDITGKVKSMEFRYTKLKTFDGKDVYIPNSDVIKKPVFNFTEDGFIRQEFYVGIAYENDIQKAKEILWDTIQGVAGVVEQEGKKPLIFTDALDTNSVSIKVLFWVDTENFKRDALQIKSEVIEEVKEKLMKNNISLPANVQELKWYNE